MRLRSFTNQLRLGLALIVLSASSASARWVVELRPLDPRPAKISFAPAIVVHAKSGLSRLEGLGVELAPGKTTQVFEVALTPDDRARQVEFNLGYISAEPLGTERAGCELTLELAGTAPDHQVTTVPLRSIEPAESSTDQFRSAYDYLTPEVRLNVAPKATRVALSISVPASCTLGKALVLNPKVWRKEDAAPPHRMIFIASDSISGDWFDEGRQFMPFIQKYFQRPGARFTSNVYSVSTNTNDTTNILTRVRYSIRGGTDFPGRPGDKGLVPAFLDQGYEALSFNSNLLMSTAATPLGFRHYFNFNIFGTAQNEMHPDIFVDMMLDWMRRHPDHDIFFFTWFDATHYRGLAPRVRPDFSLAKAINRATPVSQKWLDMQAKAMSYVDLVLERFFSEPMVEASDVIFFSDHGLNFRTLEQQTPMWGRCEDATRTANWHLVPEELRVPVGLRIHGYDPGPVPVESSLIDWVTSAVRHHNPAIDASSFQGRELRSLTANDPLLSVSHGRKGAVRINGRHYVFEDSCKPGQPPTYYNLKNFEPVSTPEGIADIERGLTTFDLTYYRSLVLDVLHGSHECPLTLGVGVAWNRDGTSAPSSIAFDPDRWFTHLELFVPAITSGPKFVFDSRHDGCVRVQAGFVDRLLPAHDEVVGTSLWALSTVRGPELPVVGDRSQVRLLSPAQKFERSESGFKAVTSTADRKPSELSKEVRAAMKSWGYIQDDDAKP